MHGAATDNPQRLSDPSFSPSRSSSNSARSCSRTSSRIRSISSNSIILHSNATAVQGAHRCRSYDIGTSSALRSRPARPARRLRSARRRARHIGARLDREHHARLAPARPAARAPACAIRGSSCTSRPSPWPVPCPNASAKPVRREHLPRRRVDRARPRPRPHGGDGRRLRLADRIEQPAQARPTCPAATVRVRSTQYPS